MRSSADELSKVYHVGEGLENKLKKEIIAAKNYDDFVGRIVSKRYTQAAIKRMLVYVMMNLKETEPQRLLYARVLAAGTEGRKLIKLLKKDEISQIPLITNINKEEDICEKVWGTLKYDILASDVYNIISGRSLYEYSDKVIRPYIAL